MAKPNVIQSRPKFHLGMRTAQEQPLGSKCYWFQQGESIASIAQKVNLHPWELIRYNFGTILPPEVNWYLQHYIGYVRPTHDGMNWKFDPKRTDVQNGRKFIYVPLFHTERLQIVHHYHKLILDRMKSLIHDFGDPKPQVGQPSFLVDIGVDGSGRHGDKENQYLNGLVGFAELIRVLVRPVEYYEKTGKRTVKKPPEFPTVVHGHGAQKPRGAGYGKGFDVAEQFWEKTINTPPEVDNVSQLKGLEGLSFQGSIRIKVAHELERMDSGSLLADLKAFIDQERRSFRGTNDPYSWGHP